jgi:uncharacterized protein
VLGRARALLSSFAAKPGQRLMMAVDLRGQWEADYPFWNASTRAPSARLRDDLELLPQLAEAGLCSAAKDISMAGILGTALMLLECSKVGAHIDLSALPHPPGHGPRDDAVAWHRWLQAFPSFGYLLSVDEDKVAEVHDHFVARDIACRVIGEVCEPRQLWLRDTGAPEHAQALLWDLQHEPFMGPRPDAHASVQDLSTPEAVIA